MYITCMNNLKAMYCESVEREFLKDFLEAAHDDFDVQVNRAFEIMRYNKGRLHHLLLRIGDTLIMKPKKAHTM